MTSPIAPNTPPPREARFLPMTPQHTKLKIVTCVPVSGPDTAPRNSIFVSHPSVSFAKGSVSPASNAKLRSCDVYIGFHGQNPNFDKCCVTNYSLLNHLSLEEIRFFAQKKNLIPLFFDTDANEIASLFNPHADNKECKEALDGLMRCHEFKLEANEGNWRSCISKDICGLLSGYRLKGRV
ncbi:UNVERIFIED_CONTAM: hypothetical protein Sradi_5355100 [Sesamum radiatum]|uniref:Uncharacterized protein n=1 Tax=Sesamum radiatum TaxID=300843 RepID=A0AAW2LT89_SESRA